MNIEKTALRRQTIEKIDALPSDYIAESNLGIFENLIRLPEFSRAQTIFAYYSLKREPDTIKILEYALQLGKTVTLPVCFKGGIMEARAISDFNELTESSYHLLEPMSSTRVIQPEALDFIIVPALAYDIEGYRLGFGGGYYDRYLVRTQAYTVGVSRERLICDVLPRETHDVPVMCVITEKKARLRNGSLA